MSLDRLRELHEEYRAEYRSYYQRYATASRHRCAVPIPAIVLVPGVGMFSFGRDKQTARVASEFYVNAINVMRGAEALSSYEPIPEREKFQDRVLGARGAEVAQDAAPASPLGPHCAGHRGGARGSERPPPAAWPRKEPA